jgi:hypothetical protein
MYRSAFMKKMYIPLLIIFLIVSFSLLFTLNNSFTQEDPSLRFGLNFNKEAYENQEWAISPKVFRRGVEPLPSKVDMSERMPEAGDQGKQNSCVGWALGYAYRSYQRLRENNKRWDYDEELLCSPSFIYNTLSIRKAEQNGTNVMDTGISVEEGMKLLESYGCLPLSIMPYNEDDNSIPPPNGYEETMKTFTIPSYQRLTKGFGNFTDKDLYQIKSALAGNEDMEGVPVEMSIIVDLTWEAYIDRLHEKDENGTEFKYLLNKKEAEGVFRNYERNKAYGHAVLIVGYDDDFAVTYEDRKTGQIVKEKGIFILQNSWGKEWANDGLFYMTYEAVKLTGMEAYRIGKNPDLPDVDDKTIANKEMGSILQKAVSIRATVEQELFGKKWLVETDIKYDNQTGFFIVDHDLKLEDRFKLFMKFNDEYSVYVVNITPDGRIRDLFPYPEEENVSTWVFYGHEYSFPRGEKEVYTFLPEGPSGRELYVLLISDRKLTQKDVTYKKKVDVKKLTKINSLIEEAFPMIADDPKVLVYPIMLMTER